MKKLFLSSGNQLVPWEGEGLVLLYPATGKNAQVGPSPFAPWAAVD
jgi:hypothetical protein